LLGRASIDTFSYSLIKRGDEEATVYRNAVIEEKKSMLKSLEIPKKLEALPHPPIPGQSVPLVR